MKVKKLIIKNIGIIADTTIELNKPLIIFYGEIMQGKTTILNAVRWAFGGSYPEDIIRHGEKNASVLLELDSGSISREWYIAKDGTTKVREINFIRDGKMVKGRVVDEIKKLLNPFLLDQDYLRKMSELERSRYFVDLFGVDTSEIDMDISKCESLARDLRIKVKMYGEIDLTEFKEVNPLPLISELNSVRQRHQQATEETQKENRAIDNHNRKVEEAELDVNECNSSITELMEKIIDLQNKRDNALVWLKANPVKQQIPAPIPPDLESLETKIREVMATNVKVEQYQKNLKSSLDKHADEKMISDLEANLRDLKKAKIAKLTDISDSCKIKGLSFDDSGNFTYQGTSAGMLSGSQIMRLSEELSNLYPKDLGIGLIDRAESLGKSVFLLIDRAKEEEKTILATVVGEKPAEIPDEVGVWIVEKGEVNENL